MFKKSKTPGAPPTQKIMVTTSKEFRNPLEAILYAFHHPEQDVILQPDGKTALLTREYVNRAEREK